VRAKVNKSGQMAHFMKDTGLTIKLTAKEGLFMLMEMFMRVSGIMIKLRAMVSILTWMVHSIKVLGKKISSMVKEEKLGQMELCMKETICKGRNKEWVFLNGLMDQYMMANSTITILREKANTVGQTDVHSLEHGKVTR
jgi:hypothetical protein